MFRILLTVALVVSIFLLIFPVTGPAEEGGPPPSPPARKIPGITTEDAFPRGCVDCHILMPEANMDVRLSTHLNQWVEKVDPKILAKAQTYAPPGVTLKGKHPAVPNALKDIPAGCISCHGKGSKMAPPLDRMLHGLHLTGGEENVFLTVFQGECTHCHKFNPATGEWSIPSGSEK